MVGFLLVSHGTMARGVYDAAEMIMGAGDKVAFCNLETDIKTFQNNLDKIVESMDSFDEIIVVCDIKSGTPYNESMRLALTDDRLKIITGLSLPMVLEMLAMSSFMDGDDLVNKGLEAGKLGITRFVPIEEDEDDF